jgi:hypothetical protein
MAKLDTNGKSWIPEIRGWRAIAMFKLYYLLPYVDKYYCQFLLINEFQTKYNFDQYF